MKRTIITALIIIVLAGLGYSRTDLRAVRLQKFLAQYPCSPLRGHVSDLLYCADHFGVDYRLYLAIAGAESTFGQKCPRGSYNFTGVRNGATRFRSIYENIYQTNRIIATGTWYRKYRQTRRIKDFVYVYKGVPPFKRYIGTVRAVFAAIDSMPVERERLRDRQAKLSKLNPPRFKPAQHDNLVAWSTTRYDKAGQRKAKPLAD